MTSFIIPNIALANFKAFLHAFISSYFAGNNTIRASEANVRLKFNYKTECTHCSLRIHTHCSLRMLSIGIVFQAPSSDDMLSGYENLKLHSLLYAVPRDIREKRITEVLDLGLTKRKDDQVKKYSGRMRRRLEIARGLLHKPKVIFLDEPTLGLDPSSRETMWEYIQRLVKEEKIT